MVGSVEERIAAKHPSRRIKDLADRALAKMGPVFEVMYAETGRPSVAPERLSKAQLLIGQADGFAERREGATLVARIGGAWRKTVSGDKGCDATDFVQACRAAGATPNVAQNIHRSRKQSAIDPRAVRHGDHRASQIVRRRIETTFG